MGKDKQLTSIAWSQASDLIGIGYNTGNIKLIKIEDTNEENSEIELILNENLSANHKQEIKMITWNDEHDKLLTVDNDGVMVVWMESMGRFVEEMINQSETN